MVFAIIFAGLHLMALAVAVADPVAGQSVFGLSQACLAIAALVYGPTRRAALAILGRYWLAALAFGGVVATTAWQAGIFGATHGALNPFAAQTEVWSLAALFLAFLAVAAGAGASGRRPFFEAFLVVCLGFAALDIGRKLQAGPDQILLATAQQTAEIYALAALFSAFAAYDAVRSPPRDRASTRVSMRLALPGAALGASVLGLVLCNMPLTLGATFAGLGAMAIALGLREWPQKLTIVNVLVGLGSIALSIVLFSIFGDAADPFGMTAVRESVQTGLKGAYGLGSGSEGGPALTWLVETGVWGAGAVALAGLAFAGRLAFSKDRRRIPSRGFALALAALIASLLTGPAGISAAGAATLAITLGLAASYADLLRQTQTAAKSKRSVPAKAADAGPDEDLIAQSA
jgi:hypothetical protein